MYYDLITQVATLALRLEDGLRVRGKGMHNRLSVRRYSISTGAYILVVVQELGLQQVRKRMVLHEAYNVVLPRCKAQWLVEYQRKIEGERYQEQKHNMRTICVSPTTKINRNRTKGVTGCAKESTRRNEETNRLV